PQILVFATLAAIILVFRYLKFLRYFKFWKQHITIQRVRFYFVNDLLNIEDGFGEIRKCFFYFLARFEIVFVVRKSKAETTPTAFRSSELFTVFYAQQDVVCMCIRFVDVVGVIR